MSPTWHQSFPCLDVRNKIIIPFNVTTVLHLPEDKGRFHLYSDTSQFFTGSVLYQIQNSKPKLIAYVNKILPEAAQNYSITELEMCSLAIK